MSIAASVVIATRNRAPYLRDCLHRLAFQSTDSRFEVIVADNGSSDGTAEVIAQFGPPVRAVYVAQPNRSKARNAGLAAAAGRIVVFCDDDTLPPSGYVHAHLRAHALHRNAVVSGPIVNVPDPEHLPPPGAQHYSRAFFCTCNVSVERAQLQAIGGFDERYELYGWEDTDVGVRLRRRRLRRVFAKDAYIYHVKPPSAVTLERRLELAREKGVMAARLVRKWPSLQTRLATGAYPANFLRAALLRAGPLRGLYERVARRRAGNSAASALALEALVDATYVDALRRALRSGDA